MGITRILRDSIFKVVQCENAEFDWAMPYFLTHDLVSKYLSFATLSRMKAKFCITAKTIELPSGEVLLF